MLLSLFIVENEHFNFCSICIKNTFILSQVNFRTSTLRAYLLFPCHHFSRLYLYCIFNLFKPTRWRTTEKQQQEGGEKKSKSPGSFLSYHVNVTVTDISTKQSL